MKNVDCYKFSYGHFNPTEENHQLLNKVIPKIPDQETGFVFLLKKMIARESVLTKFLSLRSVLIVGLFAANN